VNVKVLVRCYLSLHQHHASDNDIAAATSDRLDRNQILDNLEGMILD
jgi:hypothetical protein